MCKAFSCLVTKNKKVYWKAGIDSHTSLLEVYGKKDPQLKDDKEPPKNTFARVEITPKNKDYLKPDEWVFSVDESITPPWLKDEHEEICWKAFERWKKQIYSGMDLKEILNPIHPFKITPPKRIEKKHLKILLHWYSVWDSVGASVGASVWASVGGSVWDSVWYSVRDSVWDSVRASVRAYIGSQFSKIKKWKYVNFKYKGYPFNDAVKLWKMGLVPSYSTSDKKWRLHGGKDAKILWEGTVEELKEQAK